MASSGKCGTRKSGTENRDSGFGIREPEFGIRAHKCGAKRSAGESGVREQLKGGAAPLRVLFDSNFLMMPFQFGINLDMEMERVFGAYEAVVPTSVIRELEGLAKEKGKDGAAAKGALRMAARYKKIDTPEREADDALVRLALENKSARWIVATNDRHLRRRLAHIASILILKGKSHLEVVE